jgi:N-acetyl sugar amidotransferase
MNNLVLMENLTLKNNKKICTRCIMDSSDVNILYDEEGLCDYCKNYDLFIGPSWQNSINNPENFNEEIDRIRQAGKNNKFDCIIGLSGGLDSSYTAYVIKEKMGLRPLLVHVDAGWNTDQAVSNIEKLVNGLDLDLYTEVADWDSVKRMQVAFLRSGIPDQDLVQDAIFFSTIYHFAKKNKIKYIITGSNFSTECCREPEEWGGYLGIDKLLFDNIWKLYGDDKFIDFPLIDITIYKLWYKIVYGMKVIHPLNFISYEKKKAEKELHNRFGWQPFKHKHHESRFTRFYEDYWLPRRFGFDKRRAHFSSLIMTGQMTRDEALNRISTSEMSEHFLKQEFEYVAHKLDLSKEELQKLFESPKKYYYHYKNKRWFIALGTILMRWFRLEKRYFR